MVFVAFDFVFDGFAGVEYGMPIRQNPVSCGREGGGAYMMDIMNVEVASKVELDIGGVVVI